MLGPLKYLQARGWRVSLVRVDPEGIIDPEDVKKAITPQTALISIMLANNETGAIQPVKEIAALARERGICIHTDAAQAVGKIPVDVEELGVDYLTLAGHKLYAPKGIGALFVGQGRLLKNILFGAGQEKGMRPGTEPVPLAVALGAACKFVADLKEEGKREEKLREKFYQGLLNINEQIVRYVPPSKCLPNTLTIGFPGRKGSQILAAAPEIMASTGAACHDRKITISHVLKAMAIKPEIAAGTVRFSLGRFTTEKEIKDALTILKEIL